jgi:hypothetical protein
MSASPDVRIVYAQRFSEATTIMATTITINDTLILD